MSERNRALSALETREIERVLRETGEIVVVARELVQAVEVLAGFLVEIGKQIVPVVIGTTIKLIGKGVEAVIVGYAEVVSSIERARIKQASDDFVKTMAEASLYAEPVAAGIKEAAARRFIARMSEFGVTGLSVEGLMGG